MGKTRQERFHRATMLIFFLFFFAQSYIIWIAAKKEQFRALSIYINNQRQTNENVSFLRRLELPSYSEPNGSHNAVRGPKPAVMSQIVDRLSNGVKGVPSYEFGNDSRSNETNEMFHNRQKQLWLSIANTRRGPEDSNHNSLPNSRNSNRLSSKDKPPVLERNDDSQILSSKIATSEDRTNISSKDATFSDNQTKLGSSEEQSGAVKTAPNRPGNIASNVYHAGSDKIVLHEDAPWTPELQLCPVIPPNLVGRINVSLQTTTLNVTALGIEPGGSWRPKDCRSRNKIAIIIPFRDRMEHLLYVLQTLHPLLHRQKVEYTIFVVELATPTTFNRGMLLNIGFNEAIQRDDFQCYIFHDVDLIPEDDRNLYTCPDESSPRHMSVAVSSLDYRLPYDTIFGGVSAMTKDQFLTVNGFSNLYFGWGGEDDDLSYRLRYKGYTISRFSPQIARYIMLKHNPERKNPERMKLLNRGVREPCSEGLDTLDYQLLRVEKRQLYTWMYVHVDEKKVKHLF